MELAKNIYSVESNFTKSLYQAHPITKDFDFVTLFPVAGAIDIEESELWTTRPILNTGKHTWNETGELKGEIEFNADTETQGPFILGLSIERDIEKEEEGATNCHDAQPIDILMGSGRGGEDSDLDLGSIVAKTMNNPASLAFVIQSFRPVRT